MNKLFSVLILSVLFVACGDAPVFEKQSEDILAENNSNVAENAKDISTETERKPPDKFIFKDRHEFLSAAFKKHLINVSEDVLLKFSQVGELKIGRKIYYVAEMEIIKPAISIDRISVQTLIYDESLNIVNTIKHVQPLFADGARLYITQPEDLVIEKSEENIYQEKNILIFDSAARIVKTENYENIREIPVYANLRHTPVAVKIKSETQAAEMEKELTESMRKWRDENDKLLNGPSGEGNGGYYDSAGNFVCTTCAPVEKKYTEKEVEIDLRKELEKDLEYMVDEKADRRNRLRYDDRRTFLRELLQKEFTQPKATVMLKVSQIGELRIENKLLYVVGINYRLRNVSWDREFALTLIFNAAGEKISEVLFAEPLFADGDQLYLLKSGLKKYVFSNTGEVLTEENINTGELPTYEKLTQPPISTAKNK